MHFFAKKSIFIPKKGKKSSKSNEKRVKTIIFSFLQFDDLFHLPIENPSL